MKATYVSVWNKGSTIVRTECEIDPTNNLVTNVETSDTEVEGTLDEEYIEMPYGAQIRNFVTEDGQTYEDGQLVDDGIEYLDE